MKSVRNAVLIAAGVTLLTGGVIGIARADFTAPIAGVTQQQVSDAVNNAVTAATPADCPAPMSDALVASAGTQPKCMPRQDAVRATQVQRTSATTDSSGRFSGSWPASFNGAPGWYQAEIDLQGTNDPPYKCSFFAGTVTATAFTGKCSQLVSTTLPATLASVLGLTVSPVANAASGLTVRIVGRQ